jgi:hypothetical protein
VGRVFESPRARSNLTKRGKRSVLLTTRFLILSGLGTRPLSDSVAPREPRPTCSSPACRIIRLNHSPPRIANDSTGVFQIRRASLGKSPPGAQFLPLEHSSYCRRCRRKILSALRCIFCRDRHASRSNCSEALLIGWEEPKLPQ